MKLFVSTLFALFLFLQPAQAQFVKVGGAYVTGHSYGKAAGDLNKDGSIDIVHSRASGSDQWFRNNGSGVLTPGGTFGSYNYNSKDAAIADFDKDTWLDVIIVNAYPNNDNCGTVTCDPNLVFLNQGSGSFPSTATWTDAATDGSFDVEVGDFNNDGWMDYVVANDNSHNGGSSMWINNGTAGVGFGFTKQLFSSTVTAKGVTVGEFNGIAGDDIAFDTGDIFLSTLSFPSMTTVTVTGQGNNVESGDLDNDGDVDLVFIGNWGSVEAYLNNGSGSFTGQGAFGANNGPRFDTAIGDINRDGNLDLVVAGYSNSPPFSYGYLGDGAGGFTVDNSFISGFERTIELADMDGDSDLDAITSTGGFGDAFVWENQTPGPLEVVNTNDSGAGSLRAAITYANATANGGSPDEITFNILGAGPHTISPTSVLPSITEAVLINGYSQPGASVNTNVFAAGTNAQIRIVLDGSSLSGGPNGLYLDGGASTIRGLAMSNFAGPGRAIYLNSGGHTIEGNFLGTNAAGTVGAANGSAINVRSSGNTIGGLTPASRNLISSNGYGIEFQITGTNNDIYGNYIGTTAAGNAAMSPQQFRGIVSNQGSLNYVGGSDPDMRNVISGNGRGIALSSATTGQQNTAWTIEGNLIGTSADGTTGVPNGAGIYFQKGADENSVTDNVIAYNSGVGVGIGVFGTYAPQRNLISQNSFHDNGSIAIDLIPDGVAVPDPNGGIAAPAITQTFIDASGELTLKITAASAGTVELYKADSQASGEGKTFLSNLIPYSTPGFVQSYGMGQASNFSLSAGEFLVVTITDAVNNTSEFSTAVEVGGDPLVVTNNNDSGPGSLRAAMDYTLSIVGTDTITFNIAGAGPHTIALASALPVMTNAIIIDGYSQPGSVANTASGFDPINADIRIHIDASGSGSGNGIQFQNHSGSEIHGLVIYGAPGRAIHLSGGGHKVKGSFIGNDGVNYLGTGAVFINSGADDEIGGPNPADRNIIVGGVGHEPGASSPLIQGNYFGLKANGTEIFTQGRTTHSISGNQPIGVEVRDNVMAGATWRDITVAHANGSQASMNWSIINNRIGTDYTGTTTLPSGTNGIYVQKGAHDNLFQNNIIAGHSGAGIYITKGDGNFSPLRNEIRENSMFANGNPGIDLIAHPSGTDSNDGILTPTVTSAIIDLSGQLVISVTGERTGNFEVFEADAQNEEGERHIIRTPYAAPAPMSIFVPGAAGNGIVDGDYLIVTLTDAVGNTSEFSAAVQVEEMSLVVTNANDSGSGSLRSAITTANATANVINPDVISFNIAGDGPHVISLLSPLPVVTEAVTIDGYSQPGASANTTPAFEAMNADIRIQLDGTAQGSGDGLDFSGHIGSSVSGLTMYGFPGRAIELNSDGHTVRGNFFGTDGETHLGSGGIQINATGNTIGGPDPEDRNLIAGDGIGMEPTGSNTVIQGNFIGTDADGTSIIGTGGQRVFIGIGSNQATDVTVLDNLISGSQWHGIEIAGSDNPAILQDWEIRNNRIGTDRTGTLDLGNGRTGIYLQKGANNNTIEENILAYNGERGIIVTRGTGTEPAVQNDFLRNSMFSNVGFGIELQIGGNNDQPSPLLVSAIRQASNLGYVSMELGGAVTFPITLEFFAADSDMQEGDTFLGSRDFAVPTTNFDLSYGGVLEAGDWIVATATDANGNTSEFSGAVQVVQAVDATILADQFIDLPDQLTFEISQDLVNAVPGVRAAVQAAFDSWTAVTTALAGTKVTLSATTSLESNPALLDGINLIAQSSDSFPLSSNTLAVASKLLAVQGGDAKIISADIVFNKDLLANPDEGMGTDSQPGIWDVQSVAAHEIGHTMGMRHSGVSTATMFFSIPSGKSYRSLEVDDVAWISHRYPSLSASALGSIAGNITDGELIPGSKIGGALVIARDTTSGSRIHAYSDSNGDFLIPGVPAGDYNISIQPLDGFVDNIPGMVPGTVSPYLASITDNATFSEENWSGALEGGVEADDPAATLTVSAGENVTNVSFVTNLDNVAPSVNGASPTDDAEGVTIHPSISATFSEPIIQGGLSIVLTPTSGGAAIPGTIQVPGGSGVVATFDLDAGVNLSYSTQYTFAISGATDLKGNTQSGTWTSSFTTRAADVTPPVLLSSTPSDGGTGVAPKATLALSFSEAMDVESVKAGITICRLDNSVCSAALEGTWAFPNTAIVRALPQWVATFQPTAMLQEGSTYRVDIAATVKDQAIGAGNPVAAASSLSFTTIPDSAPNLVDAGPANNSSGISVRTSVFADFSEPMVLPTDGGGANIGVSLVDTPSGNTSGTVAGTVEILDEGRRVIFRPDAPLVFNEQYVASFSSGIEDATGNTIQAFDLTFTTAPQPTTVTVATVSPLVSIPGSVVVFSGTGFSAIPTLNSIVFTGPNGAPLQGEVASSTLSTLSAIVPDGAESGAVTITSGGQNGSIDLEIYQVIPLVDPAVARRTAESAPRDVEVTPDGGTAFVTNSGSGTVSVLDVNTGTTVASVNVGVSPLKVALSPDGTRAYVTNFGSNDVAVLDVTDVNNPILLKTIPVGLNPFGLAISPDGKRLYVAEYTSRKISIIDIEEGSGSADRAIARIGVEINSRNVEEEPDGGTRKIGVESNPRDIEVSPDGGSLFFTTETLGLRVLLLDENGSADEDAATRRITAESSTRDVEVSPDGGLIFVTTLDGALEAYRIPPDLNSTSSFQAVARLGRESNSREVEVSPDGGLIYVTNFEAGLVQVYSISSLYTPSANSASGGFALTLELVTAYSVGDNPEAVVFSAAAQVAIVANSGSNDVTVISFEHDIPDVVDSDNDGLNDDEEVLAGTDPLDDDSDDDGLTDGDEVNTLATDPNDDDSDDDGLTDGREVNDTGTDPNNPDTDGDTYADGVEVDQNGTDPLVPDEPVFDTDMDGLDDDDEIVLGTDPNNPDTDGDLSLDGEDLAPLDPTEWFHIDGVHDSRESMILELTAFLEDLTGAPVVVPEEPTCGQSGKSGKSSKKSSKKSCKSEKSDKSGKSSKKSGKSSKSDDDKLADDLLEALTWLSWNADSTKWVDPLHSARDHATDHFTRDRDAVNILDDSREEFGEHELMLTSMIDRTVGLDYAMAELAVNEAEAACGGSKKCKKAVTKARKDLSNAIKDLNKNKPGKAIDEMRKAWDRVIKYVPEGTSKGFVVDEEVEIEIEEVELLPTDYTLDQNYPNPFNPVTTIEFAIPQAVEVNLVVYDALGREVEVLVNGTMEAGRHRVRFDAGRLPSGVYLYRLSAGSYSRVSKMVLLK